jgi:hypothetical protein
MPTRASESCTSAITSSGCSAYLNSRWVGVDLRAGVRVRVRMRARFRAGLGLRIESRCGAGVGIGAGVKLKARIAVRVKNQYEDAQEPSL